MTIKRSIQIFLTFDNQKNKFFAETILLFFFFFFFFFPLLDCYNDFKGQKGTEVRTSEVPNGKYVLSVIM